MYTQCDHWLDDDILDRFLFIGQGTKVPFIEPGTEVAINGDAYHKARAGLDELTLDWTQETSRTRQLDQNRVSGHSRRERTELQVEMKVRNGQEERCCWTTKEGDLRCRTNCGHPDYCCVHADRILLVNGQPFSKKLRD